MRRVILPAVSAATTALLLAPLTTNTAAASPPGIPTVVEAHQELATVEVANESHASTYNRKAFIHWARVEGQCDAREIVLIRDGEDVTTDAKCAPISGTWYSPYDGGVWTDPQDLDIDHLVSVPATQI
ncbi:hypothetical protein [Nonomuraea angiospora]